MPNAYEHPKWQEKRKSILNRDNFTCQNSHCNTFDPSLGMVHIENSIHDCHEIHWYDNNHESIYTIDSSDDCPQYSIIFPIDTYIKMPVLQVHHLKYITGRELWEYDDEDLVTLCKRCHHLAHKTHKVYVEDELGSLVKEVDYNPINSDTGNDHQIQPWTLVDYHDKTYSETKSFNPSIRMFLLNDENNHVEKYAKEVERRAMEFIDKFFPQYTMKLVRK